MQSPFGAPAPQPTVGSLTHSHSHGGLPPMVCARALSPMLADTVAALPYGKCTSKLMLIVLTLPVGTVVQAPHRRSGSFGGNGFALPGDAADLLRSDLVTSKVVPRAPAVSFQCSQGFGSVPVPAEV